jgi:hypothetical protein
MSHQVNNIRKQPNSYIGRIEPQFNGLRENVNLKSNTVTFGNQIIPMNSFITNGPFYQSAYPIMLNHCNYLMKNEMYNNIIDFGEEKNNLSDFVYGELERILSINDKIDDSLFKSLRGNFINIIRTQNGSRLFQKYLRNTSVNIIAAIFMEMQGKFKYLIMDMYANYFYQRFFWIFGKARSSKIFKRGSFL